MKIVSAAATVLLLLSLAGAQQPPKPSSLDDLRLANGKESEKEVTARGMAYSVLRLTYRIRQSYERIMPNIRQLPVGQQSDTMI